MKKLIVIIITFIFIFEGTEYCLPCTRAKRVVQGLRVPIGVRSIDMGEIKKAEAIQEIRNRIASIKALTPTIDGLSELILELKKENVSLSKEKIEKYKKLQAEHLKTLIEANQYFIELLGIILKLNENRQIEVVNEINNDLWSLGDWAREYAELVGGLAGGGMYVWSTLDLLQLWYYKKQQFNAQEFIEAVRKSFEEYKWATVKLNAESPSFSRAWDEKAGLERIEIELRSMKHDPWNDLTRHIGRIIKAMDKMPENIRWDSSMRSKVAGIGNRIFLLGISRISKVFYKHELFDFVECLRIIQGLAEYIDDHMDIGATELDVRTRKEYLESRKETFEIIDDALSIIEGYIPEYRKARFSLKKTVEEAFKIAISEEWVQEGDASLEVTGIGPDEMYNDHRKVINIFRILFVNSREVWLERGGGTDNVQPLKLSVDFKFEREKSIFEIEVIDNAGGVHDQKDWDLFKDSDDPERQIAFLLNQSRRKGDTGLGLAEVWWLVKLLGGKVTFQNIVEDKIVKGARFIIELPDTITGFSDKIPQRNPADSNL